MKRFLGGLLSLVLLLTAGVAAHPLKAFAATSTTPTEGFNVITSPLPVKLTSAPGTTVETELRMKNQGTQPENIKVGLMKFGATGENGEPNLFDLKPTDTVASWVHFSPSEFVAQPGEWHTVKVTINIPKDANLGYYLAVTFARGSQTPDGKKTSVRGAVATLILLDTHTGNEQRKVSLSSFSADHGLYEYLPATFKIRLRNSGNIYLAPTGNVFIMRGGKIIDTLNFNEAGGSVLPKSNRVFSVSWKNGFPLFTDRLVNGKPVVDKKGNIKRDLKWNFAHANRLRFGRYTAKLLVVYDNGTSDVPIEATLNFWVIPWKVILVSLLVIGLIGFSLFSVARSALGKARARVQSLRGSKK